MALIKESDIGIVLSKFNGFHQSPSFAADKFDDCVVHYLDLKIIGWHNIGLLTQFGNAWHTWNMCTLPVTHPRISKQLGLKPCIIETYVVTRNYQMIKWRNFVMYVMHSQTVLVSQYCVTWNPIQLCLQVTIALKRMIFLRSFSIYPTLEK